MRHEQGFLLLQSARTERPGRLSTNGLSQGQMSGCESFEKYRLTWQRRVPNHISFATHDLGCGGGILEGGPVRQVGQQALQVDEEVVLLRRC